MPELGSAEDYEQRWLRVRSYNRELVSQNARMRAALLLIAEWKQPYNGFSWEMGSNGERDYFRDIAKKVLEDVQKT